MYGIVLEGGGAKGAYQLGAWSALRELGIEYCGVVGTSVGALNAAMMVQGDYYKAKDLWENMTFSKVVKVNDGILDKILNYEFISKDVTEYRDELKEVLNIEGLDITPLKETIRTHVNEDKLYNSGKDFGLVTISLSDMKGLELYLEDIPKGQVEDFLLASSYLPVFRAEKLHGKYYLDGAFYNNLPTRMLIKKGYKNIIIIRLKDNEVQFPVDKTELNIIEIIPRENLGSSLDFDNKHIRYNILLGYYDTIKEFKSLKGEKYYIEFPFNEKQVLQFILSIRVKLEKIVEILDISKEITCETLMELVIPTLKKRLGIKSNLNYADCIIGILEYMADRLNVERFKTYNLYEFIEEILQNANNIDKQNYTVIETLEGNHRLLKELLLLIKGGIISEES